MYNTLTSAKAITPEDPRYGSLIARSRNTRFVGQPDRIYVPSSAEEVRQIVETAVREKSRLAIRGGGHGLESLVDNPVVRTLVDLSRIDDVQYDTEQQAFSVGAGALAGSVYRSLYLGWGVAIPAGTCASVGLGGYVLGGGFGALCRKHGLIVDHLQAIEAVVVDSTGKAETVKATCASDDPAHDLWWAHTGAGGGNYGIVTRYWFRSPEATGYNPSLQLPTPPERTLLGSVVWPWESMTERAFTRIVRNHGEWHLAESQDESAYDTLYSGLYLNQRSVGQMVLNAQIDAGEPGSQGFLEEYFAAISNGTGISPHIQYQTLPWLQLTQRDVENRGTLTRSKSKGAYLRVPYTDEQAQTMYRYLSDINYNGHTTVVQFSYGKKINVVGPTATAVAQRDSILKAYTGTYWEDPAEDDKHIQRTRKLYRDMHSATGGVPIPDASTDGSYINYPDVDLADPRWNTSGVPWHSLYFKENYSRLQQMKAEWDPLNIFRHALSVRTGPAI